MHGPRGKFTISKIKYVGADPTIYKISSNPVLSRSACMCACCSSSLLHDGVGGCSQCEAESYMVT